MVDLPDPVDPQIATPIFKDRLSSLTLPPVSPIPATLPSQYHFYIFITRFCFFTLFQMLGNNLISFLHSTSILLLMFCSFFYFFTVFHFIPYSPYRSVSVFQLHLHHLPYPHSRPRSRFQFLFCFICSSIFHYKFSVP